MIDYYNNETRLTEILRAVVNSSTIDLGPARTREEIFVSRALGLTMWPAIPPRTTMEMWLAFIAGDTAEPAAGTYTVRTCAESCIITYARRVRSASAVVPIFPPHTHYERALAKLAGIIPIDWGVMGREWEHLLQTITSSTMPRSAVTVIGGEHVGIGPGGVITPFQDLHGYDHPWPGGGGKNLFQSALCANVGSATNNGITFTYHAASESFTVEGTATGIAANAYLFGSYGNSNPVFTLPAGTYTFSTTSGTGVVFYSYDGTTRQTYNCTPSGDTYTLSADTPITAVKPINKRSGQSYDENFQIQIEQGSAKTSWEPYENICPITPGLTLVRDDDSTLEVWGGSLDAATWVLTVTDAEIASYAGETLPGEWLSDRDVYSAGTPPTTGAQVVYKLAVPITYQLTRAEVQRALNCADYLGVGVWRLSCGCVTIIHARIQTADPVNHYDLAASSEDWTFEITIDSATASGGSGIISVPAGDHDVVIVATPGDDAGVCIIQPTLYYAAVAGLLGMRQDLEEPEPEEPVEPEPEEPVEQEPETTKRRRSK